MLSNGQLCNDRCCSRRATWKSTFCFFSGSLQMKFSEFLSKHKFKIQHLIPRQMFRTEMEKKFLRIYVGHCGSKGTHLTISFNEKPFEYGEKRELHHDCFVYIEKPLLINVFLFFGLAIKMEYIMKEAEQSSFHLLEEVNEENFQKVYSYFKEIYFKKIATLPGSDLFGDKVE